jgi:pyrimidine-nucleoside phosphorylase
MRAVDVIRSKREGGELRREEIFAFVQGATDGSWEAYQLSALLMAIVLRGMTPRETADLTEAMVLSGMKLDLSDLPGPTVDKHSTGGVGDKTSLILAPLAAACGVIVPMMSGRGLGHTGGTLDKLEAIPNFRTDLSLDEFRASLRAVGCALIGQSDEIAPADRTLYALRDVTGTVESIPLLTASILCKKIAEGISALVMDVKCGSGAFMPTREGARALARSLIDVSGRHGLRCDVLLTAMDCPLGRKVGNSLEVIEAVEVLRGQGPPDTTELSVQLATRMVHLAGITPSLHAARSRVQDALTSGRGLEKLRQIIARQGGDARVVDEFAYLPQAPHRHLVRATRPGVFQGFDAGKLGRACCVLGAGRERVRDSVDHSVGGVFLVERGETVRAGDALMELHYRDEDRLGRALEFLQEDEPVRDGTLPLVLEVLSEGVRS